MINHQHTLVHQELDYKCEVRSTLDSVKLVDIIKKLNLSRDDS